MNNIEFLYVHRQNISTYVHGSYEEVKYIHALPYLCDVGTPEMSRFNILSKLMLNNNVLCSHTQRMAYTVQQHHSVDRGLYAIHHTSAFEGMAGC